MPLVRRRRLPRPVPPEQEVSIRWRISRRDLEDVVRAMESGGGMPVRLRVAGDLHLEFLDGGEIDVRAHLSVVRPAKRTRLAE